MSQLFMYYTMTLSWNTQTERHLFASLVEYLAMEEDSSSSSSESLSDDDDMSVSSNESIGELMMTVYDYGTILFTQGEDNCRVISQPDLVIDNLPDNDRTTLEFRFRKEDLKLICKLLWPRLNEYFIGEYDKIHLAHRHYVHFETGMLMLLYRLAFPKRLRPEMEIRFSCNKTKISETIKTFALAIRQLATKYFSDITIWKNHVESLAKLISVETEGVVNNVFGFIDGTFRPTCRPSRHQKIAYSGHKRRHGIKFQSVVIPNGMVAALHGPEAGSRHDSFLLGESEILDQLESMFPTANYSLYGDPAYPQSGWLHGGYRNPRPNTPQAEYNKLLSSVRESVEWGFNGVLQQFATLDYKKELMIYRSPVAAYYIVAAFLQNLRVCLYGNEISLYFQADGMIDNRMNINEYLSLID